MLRRVFRRVEVAVGIAVEVQPVPLTDAAMDRFWSTSEMQRLQRLGEYLNRRALRDRSITAADIIMNDGRQAAHGATGV